MTPLDTLTCEAANLVGWYVGGASAAFAVALLMLRIVLSPTLGPGRDKHPDRFFEWRRAFRYLLWLVPIAWVAGAAWLGGVFMYCYARGIANAATTVIGLFLFLAIVTAANQIGRRSIR